MAKNKHPLVDLQGTFSTITFVNSKAYGKHVRQPRGTHKEAKLNATLQQNTSKTPLVNATAKVVHDYIKHIAGPFKQTDLWQELTSRLFKAASTALPDLLCSLQGLEINKHYRLSRLMAPPQVEVSVSSDHLQVTLETLQHPAFAKGVPADGYYYTVHVLWVDSPTGACGSAAIETEWIFFSDELPYYALTFDVPKGGADCVVVLEVQAGCREQVLDGMKGRAMWVAGVGNRQ